MTLADLLGSRTEPIEATYVLSTPAGDLQFYDGPGHDQIIAVFAKGTWATVRKLGPVPTTET